MTNDYSRFVAPIPDDQLASLSDLIDKLRAAQVVVAAAEADLRTAKEAERLLAEVLVPGKMAELGVSDFKTHSGMRVKVEEKLRVSPPKETREEMLNWLEKAGHGSLIKTTVSVAFGKNEREKAIALGALLTEQHLVSKEERKVEPATLRAFVSRILREGTSLPTELLGIYQQPLAEITEGGVAPCPFE